MVRRWGFSLVATVVGLLAIAPGAMAGNAYVANSGAGTVTVIDATRNAPIATIPVGGEPVDVAVTPDATRAYVVDSKGGAVVVVDTATNTVAGVPIVVGEKPLGIAISPDGLSAYVSNSGSDTVSVLSTQTNTKIGPDVAVGDEPDGVAITSDGLLAFVAQRGGDLSAIDTRTRTVIGTVADPLGPSRIAIGPRGGRALVTNRSSNSVTVFNPANRAVVGAPVVVGSQPAGIGIESSGTFAYAASPTDGTVTPFNTSLNAPIGGPLAFPGATGIALRPDGLAGYVTNATAGSVSILDTTRNASTGTIPVGAAPLGVAFAPNQGPVASFWVSPTRRRAKKALTFHGAGSTDADGSIVHYAWDFGDGKRVQGKAPTRTHRYRRPGTYLPSLLVTDNEGCSTEFVYTGQTASCTGSAAAAITIPTQVLPTHGPRLKIRGSKRQRLRGSVKIRARCLRPKCSMWARGTARTVVKRGQTKKRRSHRIRLAESPRFHRRWRTLRLRLPRGTRRALARTIRRGGKSTARVTVIATGPLGEQTAAKRKIKLVLPRRR